MTDYALGIDRDLRPGDRVMLEREVMSFTAPPWVGYADARHAATGSTAMVIETVALPASGMTLLRVVIETLPLRFATVVPAEVRWLEEVGA